MTIRSRLSIALAVAFLGFAGSTTINFLQIQEMRKSQDLGAQRALDAA
jgi:hypothetical protein